MEEKELPIEKGEKLNQALKRLTGKELIPSNVILNKVLPGLGATYSEIEAKRHSIIIEPNVPVILGKKEKHGDILTVVGRIKTKSIEKYLRSPFPVYKKIMVTPEGFWKIKEAAENANVDIFKDYFLLFDECEKITQDLDYRESISQPMGDFFRFKTKAFVSATTLHVSHPEFEKQGFYELKVTPNFEYRENLELVVTSRFIEKVRERLEMLAESPHICIFYNSVTGINKIITSLNLKDNYKIFCSDKKATELRKDGLIHSFDEITMSLAKYNFFTSRFYSAVDIELDVLPDVIMLTSLRIPGYQSPKYKNKPALHTLIDPRSEAIQIQGRFRNTHNGKRFNSFTHITTIDRSIYALRRDQIECELETFRQDYDELKVKHDKAKNQEKIALSKDLNNLSYNDYLDRNGEFNYFALDNRYNAERVKHLYSDYTNLIAAYKDTGYFRLKESIEYEEVERVSVRSSKKPSYKEMVWNIFENIRGKSIAEIDNYAIGMRGGFEDTDFIISAYKLVGRKILSHPTKKGITGLMDEALTEKKAQMAESEMLFSDRILLDIHNEFKADISKQIPVAETKTRLQMIYNSHNINKRITNKTIGDYYKHSHNKSKNPYFVLEYLLPEHQERLKKESLY